MVILIEVKYLKVKLKQYFCLLILTLFILPTNVATAEDLSKYDTKYSIKDKDVPTILYETIAELGYNSDNVSIAFYDFKDDAHYYLNSDITMIGASTTKVATAALFTSLVNQGYLTFDSQIPFVAEMYEEGGGNITNSEIQPTYALSDLIFEMLHNSDNTAWNLLTDYYYSNFGNYQADLLAFSNADIIDPSLYEFNHVNAQVLEGILIEIASSYLYPNVTEIMMNSQNEWLSKYYVNENMATKYGFLDTYFHDIGIYYDDQGAPLYALVIMTDQLDLETDGMENQFFGLINLRLNRWYSFHHH